MLNFDSYLYYCSYLMSFKKTQSVSSSVQKIFFISPNHMPSGSLDRLSEINARSALVNCKPAFLVPGSAPGAGGLRLSQPTMALYHLVKKSGRNMRRVFVAFIDYSFAFECANRNPLLNKAP